MKASIAEAARSADAMKEVAGSIAVSTGVTSKMANDQRAFWKMQMRAYVSVNYREIAPQNPEKGYRFEIRLTLINTGNTPAHGLVYSAKADVLPYPLPDDFDLTLTHTAGASRSDVGPGQNRIMTALPPRIYSDEEVFDFSAGKTRLYMWGLATYNDAFGHARNVTFCQYVSWYVDGKTTGTNTGRHNESD
jgi:hypothetical protein